ncbi:MAG: putative glucose/L-sorbosone dehydrogenase, distantly related to bacterial beta-galactosidase [Fibrobacteres bacterium]|nr:putative glucose/L-sorbosone dehydrogenase, distantly related to bacterial beta-galactosidase [Fibrobacterota bacterium]
MIRTTRTSALLALAACVCGRAQIPTGVAFEAFYDQAVISFDQPTFVGPVPGDPDQLIIVERAGKVSRLVKAAGGYEKKPWFAVDADTATHWDGAWTVEFHPKFLENHLFYVLFRQKINATRSVIEEWKADPSGLANPVKLRSVIEFNQKGIHSSGDMKFGPDGFLYSSQGDRQQSGQDMNEMWGKVIRIDVDRKDPGLEYAIPPDNPFRNAAGTRPEIFATGFRMPWRMSFDRLNGDLILGDVGDVTAEEINLVAKGKNYGAGAVEGKCAADCAKFTEPILAETRAEGICVIGGFVYRADPASQFYGVYLFGDYGTKKIYGARLNAAKTGFSEMKSVAGAMPGNVSALGLDGRGNYYAAMYKETGASTRSQIYRLKHTELRPVAGTGILHSAFRRHRDPSEQGSAPSGYRVYGLDGRLRTGKFPESTGSPDILILREAGTGRVAKWILP